MLVRPLRAVVSTVAEGADGRDQGPVLELEPVVLVVVPIWHSGIDAQSVQTQPSLRMAQMPSSTQLP